MDKFCITQKIPTHKSATARLARKKLVIDRSLRDNVTTRITRRLPAKERERLFVGGRDLMK